MVDVISYSWLVPIVAMGFITVWLVSKKKYAPTANRIERPKPIEAVLPPILFLVTTGGFWLVFSGYLDPLWGILPQRRESILIVTSAFLDIAPVLFALRWLRSGLQSVRLTKVNWKFSLVLGAITSALILVPTTLVAPALSSKLLHMEPSFIIALLFSGFGEELFFRGFMQTRFEGTLGTRSGIFLTAILFNLSHLPNWLLVLRTPILIALADVILALPVSILLGYIAHKSNNLLGSTLYHISYNLPLVLLS